MRLSIVLTLSLSFLSPASAADWGHLKMRLVYDGEPPLPKRFNTGSGEITDDSLLVSKSDRGIQNVFVYLLPDRSERFEVHSDYSPTAASKVTMKIAGAKLVPRAAIVRTTQTLAFQNNDTAGYNVKIDLFYNKPFSALVPIGGSTSATFTAEENMPAPVTCTIHPLVGYLLIRNDPYFALSDEHGRVNIENLPTGKRTFVVWHERMGFVQKATRNEMPIHWPRGRVTVEIAPGDHDLGDIKLAPALFK
jgi:hypothetical protein